jgi:hypothetical protein
MAFHSPMDEAQWQEAKIDYVQMRVNLRALRRRHPAHNAEQIMLMQKYAKTIQDFGNELLKPRGKIKASKLNALNNKIVDDFIDYMSARSPDK